MKWKLVIVMATVTLCAMVAQARAEVSEKTSTDYENKVQMSPAKLTELRTLVEQMFSRTYSGVITRWNRDAGSGFTAMPAGQQFQFQGSIGYNMALGKPDGAKSDADVAFLYKYNGGDNQPTSGTLNAIKLKELARDVFRTDMPPPSPPTAPGSPYSYEIKNPVVAINVPATPTQDHVDVAFFNELKDTANPSRATCVLPPVTTMPCSQLSWGSPAPGGDPSSWVASDRLNLTATLNTGFDANPTNRALINRAGKIFKEWRFGLGQYAADEEKVPSLALITLMYNLLKGGSVNYTNTFILLRDTLSKGAKDNFNNGNCTTRPEDFKILSVTYPFADLLSKLTTTEKRSFCLSFMDFKSAVEYATRPANEVTEAQAIDRLKPYLPLFP